MHLFLLIPESLKCVRNYTDIQKGLIMELTKIRHITIYICELSKLDATFIEVICSFKL